MKNFKLTSITLGLILSMEILANPIFSNDLLTKAKNGDSSAQLELADVYLHGYGIEEDDVQAESWAIKSAESGNVNAMYWLGDGYTTYAGLIEDMDSIDAEDHYKKAFIWFSKGSDLNHTDSMVGLAKLYRDGEGVTKDTDKAFDLFKKAASLGSKEAMRDIEFMYQYGIGVEKNLDTAKFWEDKAKI